jgi:hypothetical protein
MLTVSVLHTGIEKILQCQTDSNVLLSFDYNCYSKTARPFDEVED